MHNGNISQKEVAIYNNKCALAEALAEKTEAMELDFERRISFGATVEAGPLKLELPYIVSRGSGYFSLKAAAK